MSTTPEPNYPERVHAALQDYVGSRLRFYATKRLRDLLKKDVLMFALRGVATSSDFVEQAFAALESSSEETVMGNTSQRILNELSEGVIDAGDIFAERDSTLWVVEVKSQRNTLNAGGLAQTVRTLKNRVEHQTTFQPARRRRAVRAMIGVLRGPEIDREMVFSSSETRTENQDLEGFRYRYLVGPALWRWFTGRSSIYALIGDPRQLAAPLIPAREACLARMQEEMSNLLAAKGLPEDIGSVIRITFETDEEDTG